MNKDHRPNGLWSFVCLGGITVLKNDGYRSYRTIVFDHLAANEAGFFVVEC